MKNFFFFLLIFFPTLQARNPLLLRHEEADVIGKKIWQNECNGTIEGLTSWNPGEDHASIGIGHFIWYPKKQKMLFQESFPSLVVYFKKHKVKLPVWLEKATYCPWSNREEFMAAQQDKRMRELRNILIERTDLQVQFIIERLNTALTNFEKKLPHKKYIHVKNQFDRIAKSPNGVYALLDYVNFKGVGFDPKEAYKNQGWGLIQVLERLKGTKPGKSALEEFAQAAKEILTLRVKNAPRKRNEERWLKGWFNRIDTYIA